MKNLAIKAVGTGPGFYYAEGHEWREMSPGEEVDYLVSSLVTLGNSAKSLANKGGDMTIALTAVGDSTPMPPDVTVSGVTRKDFVKFQEDAQKIHNKMLQYGKKIANRKK